MAESKLKYDAHESGVDINKIIDDAMEKRDRYVHIFISGVGTSIYVRPDDNELMRWKPNPYDNKPLCGNCGRASDQAYPHCPWCGEELGISIEEFSGVKPSGKSRKSEIARRYMEKVINSKEEKTDE